MSTPDEFQIPFRIYKKEVRDDGSLLVYGKAAGDDLDLDDQILDKGFLEKRMGEWFEEWGNIRQMHSSNLPPAGKAMEIDIKDDGVYVKGLIIEPTAKELVKAGVYQAYSVGISKPRIVRDLTAKGGRVTDGIVSEISLVDYPANPTCKMSLCKRRSDGSLDDSGVMYVGDQEIPAEQRLNIIKGAFEILAKVATTVEKRDSMEVEIEKKHSQGPTPGKKKAPLIHDDDADGDVGTTDRPMKGAEAEVEKKAQDDDSDDDSDQDDNSDDSDDDDDDNDDDNDDNDDNEAADAKVRKAEGPHQKMPPKQVPKEQFSGAVHSDLDSDANAAGDTNPVADSDDAVDPGHNSPANYPAPKRVKKGRTCPTCGGSGMLGDGDKCSKCGGVGKIKKSVVKKADAQMLKGLREDSREAPLFIRRYHDALCPAISNSVFKDRYGFDRIEAVKDNGNSMFTELQKSIREDNGSGKQLERMISLTDAYASAKAISALNPQFLSKVLENMWGETGLNVSASRIDLPSSQRESIQGDTTAQRGPTTNVRGDQQRRSPAESRSSGDSGARIPNSSNVVYPEDIGRTEYVPGEQRRSPGDMKKAIGGRGPVDGLAAAVYDNAAANQARSAVQQLHDHVSLTWPDMCPLGHAQSNPAATNHQGTGRIGFPRIDMRDAEYPKAVPMATAHAAESAAGVPGRLNKAMLSGESTFGAPVLKKMAKLENELKKAKKANKSLKVKIKKIGAEPDLRKAPVRGAVNDPLAILKGRQPQAATETDEDTLREYLTALAGAGSAQYSHAAEAHLHKNK